MSVGNSCLRPINIVTVNVHWNPWFLYMGFRIQTQVLVLVWQACCRLCCLPSPCFHTHPFFPTLTFTSFKCKATFWVHLYLLRFLSIDLYQIMKTEQLETICIYQLKLCGTVCIYTSTFSSTFSPPFTKNNVFSHNISWLCFTSLYSSKFFPISPPF